MRIDESGPVFNHDHIDHPPVAKPRHADQTPVPVPAQLVPVQKNIPPGHQARKLPAGFLSVVLSGPALVRHLGSVDAAQPQALAAVQDQRVAVQHRLDPHHPVSGKDALGQQEKGKKSRQGAAHHPKKEGNPGGCLLS
jgi:hypothetical protein